MTGPEQRSPAVLAARAGTAGWRVAAVAQQAAVPDHTEIAMVAGQLVDTLRALTGLCGVLAVQVSGYSVGRNLYDDDGADPHVRLADAADLAAVLARDLDRVERVANRFWSHISHLGIHSDGPEGAP
jgi:hypothetical protein